MTSLFLATRDGLLVCHSRDGEWQVAERQLEGRHLTGIVAGPGFILAGAVDGILRSDDGRSWTEITQGLSGKHIRWLDAHPQAPDRVFAGTEPASVFVSDDGGLSWRICDEVPELRDRFGWSLPYSPEAGCVRGFALHGNRAYAAVEVGGVLRSDDAGQTWTLAAGSDGKPSFSRPSAPLIHPDVHSIVVHPSSPDVVFAPTGGGFYRSMDGGATWELLYDCYCRACWTDPEDPQRIILGPADGVDRNGRIELTNDGGRHWSSASAGLDVPWPGTMVERLVSAGGELLAILSNGRLYSSSATLLQWRPILESAKGVTAVAFSV
ncbi:MAG: WD40/YVTN/BNR-like repeat-containing protein [Anaerolineales bacterium]